MDRFVYTALTAMNSAMNRQRTVANNLANASTPGFRQEIFSVTPATLRDGNIEARVMARGNVRGADMATGVVTATGQPLDIAVQGEALIAFQAPGGGEFYSRRGDLRLTPTGLLENGEGLPVMGNAGPITVPLGQRISIGEDGTILAEDPNAPGVPPQAIGQIKLVSPQGSPLAKGVDSFLKVPGGGVLPPDPTARVTSGALEQSNVQTAATLVDMIEAQRSFEMRAQVLQKAGELDEASSRLLTMG